MSKNKGNKTSGKKGNPKQSALLNKKNPEENVKGSTKADESKTESSSSTEKNPEENVKASTEEADTNTESVSSSNVSITDEKERVLKQIDVLNAQIIACQEESTSYNNAYISSAIICAIITAVGGWMSENPSGIPIAVIYFIPIVYLSMVFNIIKYTGFQVQLGTYRHKLEKRIDDLMFDNQDIICLMEMKTEDRGLFKLSGIGVGFFLLPPILILWVIVTSIPGNEMMKFTFNWIYFAELLICITLVCVVIKNIMQDKPNYKEPEKKKLFFLLKKHMK